MDKKNEWYELIERTKHFYVNFEVFEKQVENNPIFYMELYNLRNVILSFLDKKKGLNSKQILEAVFSEIYNFICMQNYDFIIFHKLSPLYNNVYEACLFATLGMFLHDTTRIKGKSLRKFIEANASINPNRKNKAFELDNAETLLRQKRYRLLSSRPTYNQRSECSAMPKDSEYEWTLMYALDNEKAALQDTFKRIGNLYNDIYKEFHSNKDDGYIDRLEKAYKRFLSKLKKIKFENYLELQKTFLSHISKDKTYYGMNLYRFEKANRLYINTNEIKSLLECTNDIEERNILAKSSILNGIYFPKLYENFASLSTLQEISFCSINFSIFFDYVVSSSRLIIDELVEKGYWGEVWEMFFLETINEMTENVFYDPQKIDYSIAPCSQEKFEKILAEPVRDLLFQATGKIFT